MGLIAHQQNVIVLKKIGGLNGKKKTSFFSSPHGSVLLQIIKRRLQINYNLIGGQGSIRKG